MKGSFLRITGKGRTFVYFFACTDSPAGSTPVAACTFDGI
jgi:hypothetical protein